MKNIKVKKVRILIFIVFSFSLFFLYLKFFPYTLPIEKSTYKHQLYLTGQVPDKLKNWAIAIEDKRFYHHFWIDFLAILRAIKADLEAWSFVQWASTISQQVVKLSENNFFKRGVLTKLSEIFKAINLNFHYSKNQILTYWINNVDFLNGVKGFKSACKIYFWRTCNRLFDSELLFLFATYQIWKNPFTNFYQIKKRSYILCEQLQHNWVNLHCDNLDTLPPKSKKDLKFNVPNLTSFYLYKLQHPDKIKLNKYYYDLVENILKDTKNYRKNMWIGDCCVLILNKEGKVLTMNTCRQPGDDYLKNSWVNGCLAKRQTWSAIKPFLYLLSMLKFWRTWGTVLEDKPVSFLLNWLNKYIPRNFDLKYHGDVNLAWALWNSLNVPAVLTLDKIWVENFLKFLSNLRLAFGDDPTVVAKDYEKFSPDKLWLSAALWTYEMSVLEFANLWRIFLLDNFSLSKSYSNWWQAVTEIYKILSDNKNRLISFWIDNVLDVLGWAVKTWTSRHFVDGRTCSASREKQIVLCVWAGNYNGAGMKGSGVQTAGVLWNLIVGKLR